ncbi:MULTISPECIES: GAP1-N1 domain-containing protein [unclassified Nocardioides]|uniref:GAP1-N1 domain-containing protein n=1 Tax=unclassified Nocardioides TaxID=2615069 RepID=UPI0030151D34
MTMKIRTEQALFGYNEGHRLLVSSRSLSSETQRALRTLTDAAFEGAVTTYLTVQPLETENAQAFVRTWRADDWNRPGSVWSHVLFVEHSDLSKMTGFGAITKAFRRPHPAAGALSNAELSAYQVALDIAGDQRVGPVNADIEILRQIIHATYSTNDPIQFRVNQVENFESLLLAMTEQQWPRLRRTFSSRTRQRAASATYDLELVEKLSRSTAANPLADQGSRDVGRWVDWLVRDLIQPDENFRLFLRLGGTESRTGRSELRRLADLYDRLAQPNPDIIKTALAVRHAYPLPESHSLLKAALFGPADHSRYGGWPVDEASRLTAALAASPSLDLRGLDFGSRLAQLAMSPGGAEEVGRMDLEALPLEALEPVVADVANAVDITAAVALANALPELGALVVARRPELLGQPAVWAEGDAALLLDILELQNRDTVIAVLTSLLEFRAIEPLAAVASANPARWWDLLGWVGTRPSSDLVAGAEVLRAVLARIGSAALGSPPEGSLQSSGELVALALAADLGVGLWRRAPAKDWANLISHLPELDAPRNVIERTYSVALASALQSNSAKVRTQGWQMTFEFLHFALLDPGFDPEGWYLLANVLPAGEEWDRCSRLRRGAAWEARRDQWPPASVARLIEASTPYQYDMADLISARSEKKKKDSWLRSVLRLLE